MEKDYIENLKVIAGVGGNKVSQQNLLILMGKYHLTEDKMEEIKEYCYHHGIIIYNEEDNVDSYDEIKLVQQRTRKTVSAEEKKRQNKAKIIARHIMHLASVKAHKRVEGKGWLCGTYTSSIRRNVESYLVSKFDESEMDYIIEHMPVDNKEDTCFLMLDGADPQKAIHYSDELNSLIPVLHINRFYN